MGARERAQQQPRGAGSRASAGSAQAAAPHTACSAAEAALDRLLAVFSSHVATRKQQQQQQLVRLPRADRRRRRPWALKAAAGEEEAGGGASVAPQTPLRGIVTAAAVAVQQQ